MPYRTAINHTFDAGAAMGLALTFAGFLPPFAAILAGCWYLVQIFESKTVQNYLCKRRIRLHARRLQKLEAEKLIITAQIAAIEDVRIAKAYGAEKVLEARADAASGRTLQALAEKLTG